MSIILSVGVLGYLFSKVGPGEVLRAIRNASPAGLLAYMVVSMVSTILRNIRYLDLVRGTGTDIPITGWQMFLVTLVRNLFSDLLPARVGTLVYVVLLKARFGFPVEIGTSVWAIAFVLDLVVMVPLMAVGIGVVGAVRLGVSPPLLWSVAGAFFLLTVLAYRYLPGIMRLAGRLARRLRRAASLGDKLVLTASEIETIHRAGIFWRVIILSVFVRVLKYACIAFLVYAILNPIDPETYTLRGIGYWPVFVGASLAELSASTPMSGIGGFGAYEGVWTGAFHLLGYPKGLAFLSGISAHVITQVFGYSIGAVAMLILAAPLIRRRRRRG